MLYICEIHYLSLDWYEWFSKNERFTAGGSLGRENLMFALPIMHDGHDQKHNYENFTSSFGRVGKRKCTKKRAARAARFFLFVQPIKSLICAVVVAFVIS